MFALWWRNRGADPRAPGPAEPLLSERVLLAARGFALVALGVAAVFFLPPATAIDFWPWKLTPLTARVLACLTAQVGVGALVLSRDRRWGTWRLIVQTFFVATALLLVGALRARDEFNTGDVMTYLYVGGLLAADVALAVLYVRTERRTTGRRPLPASPPGRPLSGS